MYDAIIVGARVAGSPAAFLLAQRGLKVLLVDRDSFPSDVPLSTLLLHPPAIERLKRWGVMDAIAERCPPIKRWRMTMGPLTLEGAPPDFDGPSLAYAPRRLVLDQVLVDAARAAGVEVREGFATEEILMEDGKVTGIRGIDANGQEKVEWARIVIGADGANSIVARSVQAEEYHMQAPRVGTAFALWSGLELPKNIQLEYHHQIHRGVYAWVTTDKDVLVGVNWRADEIAGVMKDVEPHYLEAIKFCAPDLGGRLAHASRVSPFVGGHARNFYRKPYGPGWALLGDAGGSYELTSGQGMTNAFRQADLLAAAVVEGLSGRRFMDETLADFHEARDEFELPFRRFTYEQTTQQPIPEAAMALFGAIAASPSATNGYFGLFAQTVQPADFFDPEHLGRIMSGVDFHGLR